MKLVIVESPTKARKLAGYLGSDFLVESSVGHVRDLPKKTLGVDLENNYEPEYEISDGKKRVVAQLRKLAKGVDTVVLAMDPDREGEAIAWHVKHLLEEKTGKDVKYVRATFNQITKTAVLEALSKPGEIDIDLVNAQQARRVVDRLVGYKVSPVLWSKVRRGLSAGRVQSVALRLVVEREREIEAFVADEYWEVGVALNLDKISQEDNAKLANQIFIDGKEAKELPAGILVSELEKVDGKKYEPVKEDDVTQVVADLEKSAYQITDIEQKERKRSSLPPFTTSTLQQAAATRYGFSAKQTMALAQKLYEEGLITYHRTDSFNLAKEAVASARDLIKTKYGPEYLPTSPKIFSKKSKNAQEAHEAIRPTNFEINKDVVAGRAASLEERHAKLYDLIWSRTMASQMTDAKYLQTKVVIGADVDVAKLKARTNKYQLKITGSVKKFAGWTVLFTNNSDRLLPELEANQDLHLTAINPVQKFTQPPPRFNDASLIRELEKKGIGRPSTYASIISVIIDRRYVDRKEKRFWATTIGKVVSDFLLENFPEIMNYDFTAKMEDDLDKISRGEKEWKKVVAAFFDPLAKKIKEVNKDAERAEIPVVKTGVKCPDCGDGQAVNKDGDKIEPGEIVIRDGRYGKFKSCNRYPNCKFTENIVEKLEGQHCPLCKKGDIVIKPTRWGKSFYGCGRYPKCDWASWVKPAPDYVLTKEEWVVMQKEREERKKARAARFAKKGGKTTAKKTAKKKKPTKTK